MAETHIQWANRVWNPSTGCDRVSAGCDHCYALTMAKRLKGMGQAKYQNDGDPRTSGPGFGLTVHEDTLTQPLSWRKPSKIFVNSMSDLFHADVPDNFLAKVFAVMAATPWHTFQVLTKRHARMRSLLGSAQFQDLFEREFLDLTVNRYPKLAQDRWSYPLPNVHLGVSAEDQRWADIRIPALIDTPAAVRFVSAEPLLGPIDLFGQLDQHGHRPRLTYWLDGRPGCGPAETSSTGLAMRPLTVGPRLDWMIVGGESGPGARPMGIGWVRHLVNECGQSGVPIFVKQLGSVWAKTNAPGDPKGGDPQWWPADLRVRQFPRAEDVAA